MAAGPSRPLSGFRAHEQLSRALLGFISVLVHPGSSITQGLEGQREWAERMGGGGVLSPPSWLKQQWWLHC